jgi:hypothetical protein
MNNQFNQNMNNNNLINYQNNNNNMNNPNFNQSNINQNKNLNSNKYNNPTNVLMTQNKNDSSIYEDIYTYIKGDPYRITFITQNGSKKKFSIPSSLRNNELYYIADKINNPEFFEYSDVNFIKLFCVNNNNKIFIPNDDNLIGYYMDDSQILIEETPICYNSELMMNIIFKSDKVKKINVIIPYNFTVKDLINAFFNKNKIAQHNQKYFFFFQKVKP